MTKDNTHGPDSYDWAAIRREAVDGIAAEDIDETRKQTWRPQDDAKRPDGRLAWTTWGELRSRPMPETRWIVDGIIPARGLGLLAGIPKAGKSTMARHLAVSVSTGTNWLGREVEIGTAFYASFHGEYQEAEVREHLSQLGAPDSMGLYLGPAPGKRHVSSALQGIVDEYSPQLLILDTIGRIWGGTDLNTYNEVISAFAPIAALANERNICILCLHHARKGGGGHGTEVLGSQAIGGSADVVLSLGVDDQDRRTIYAIGRGSASLDRSFVELGDDGRVTIAETVRAARRRDLGDEIFQFVKRSTGQVSRDQILEGVKGRRNELVGALNRLVDDGDVSREGSGAGRSPYLYSYPGRLSDSGAEYETNIMESIG